MKNICIIAGSLTDYQILKPVITKIQNDTSVCLTVIFTQKYQTPEFSITYSRLEQEGFTLEENTDIQLNNPKEYIQTTFTDFEQQEYNRLLKQVQPGMVLLSGNSYPAYTAALCAFSNQIPIAHIDGGKSTFDLWDQSFGYGITKLSQLHFTSTETFRQQIIKFGEHPETVFNVGSLLMENIKKIDLPAKKPFLKSIDLEKKHPYVFVAFEPDASEGSHNESIFENLLAALCSKTLSRYCIVFSPPKDKGLGKIISRMIKTFTHKYPLRTRMLASRDLKDSAGAIKHSAAMVSNCFNDLVVASGFKTPAINIGKDFQETVYNPITAKPETGEISDAFKTAFSLPFNQSLVRNPSAFEKRHPVRAIVETVKSFHPSDMRQKAYFSG